MAWPLWGQNERHHATVKSIESEEYRCAGWTPII
jgi:hypothetical protein